VAFATPLQIISPQIKFSFSNLTV